MVGAGAAVGAAQGLSLWTTALLAVLPWLVVRARSAAQAWLAMLAFYLMLARAVALDGEAFFGTPLRGPLTLLACAVLLASAWLVLWRLRELSPVLGLAVVLALLGLPPLGVIGLGHPLNAAGVLYPGWAFGGLVLTVALLSALVQHAQPAARAAALALVLAAGLANLAGDADSEPEQAVHTTLGRFPEDAAGRQAFAAQVRQLLRAQALDAAAPMVLVPENLMGVLDAQALAEVADTTALTGKPLALGGLVALPEGLAPVVRFVHRGRVSDATVRVPVPFAYRDSDVPVVAEGFFGAATVEAGGRRIGALVCYEALLAWPAASAAAGARDGVVLVANNWWTRADSNVSAVQTHTALAWARLFDQPLYVAVNHDRDR